MMNVIGLFSSLKMCDEQDKQLDALKTEEGKLTLERDSLLEEKDELSIEVASLESQVIGTFTFI